MNSIEIDRLTINFAALPRIAEISIPPLEHNNRANRIRDPTIREEICDPTVTVDMYDDRQRINENKDMEMPAAEVNQIGEEGIQAAVLIGIRRRKMKKHKLKKLRKKMKFEWAKVRCDCFVRFGIFFFNCSFHSVA